MQFHRITKLFLLLTLLGSHLTQAAKADILDEIMWGTVGAVVVGAAYEAAKNECRTVLDSDSGKQRIACKNPMGGKSFALTHKDPPGPDAKPGRETKGATTQWEKQGGMDAANEDFDAKNPSDVQEIPGGGRVGTLPDGRKIIVRPNSQDGRPTLEIQSGRKREKVRYGS